MSVEVIKAAADSGGGVALVTVIGTQGSVPRHTGSKMLVRRTGEIVGTVGGGLGEAMAVDAAKTCIKEKCSRTVTVEMQGIEAEGAEHLCGGMGTMLVEYVPDERALSRGRQCPGGRAPRRAGEEAGGHGGGRSGTVSMAVLEESGPPPSGIPARSAGRASLHGHGKAAVRRRRDGIFYDPVLPREKLLILGGGHVGQALAARWPQGSTSR